MGIQKKDMSHDEASIGYSQPVTNSLGIPDSHPDHPNMEITAAEPEEAPMNEKRKANSQGKVTKVDVDVPPNGGYGWVIVATVFLINAHTWGVNSSYGVFLSYYLANNTFPNSSALEYAFVGGLSVSMALAISPLGTFCTRVAGTRTTLLIGVVLQTVSLLGASFATEIWHLFLSQGLCFGWGMGFLFVGTVGVVPQWFSTRRSFANAISTGGSGFGGLIYSLATNAMISSIGLSWAFRVLAIISCIVNIICAILMKDRNKHVGSIHIALDLSFLRRPEFLLLLGWGFFSLLGYVVCLFSLPNYASSIGLTSQQGSVIGALFNGGQALGRPLVGYFSDAAGRINMAGGCTFLGGLFILVIWIFAKSYGVMIFYAIIMGVVSGTFWCTVGPVGAEVVGLQLLPSALSILWLLLVLPTTFSEPIGLELRASSGNIYLHAQIFAGFMYIVAAICMLMLRAWKINELDRLAAAEPKIQEMGIRDDDVLHNNDLSEADIVKETNAIDQRHSMALSSTRSTSKKAKYGAFTRSVWKWRHV